MRRVLQQPVVVVGGVVAVVAAAAGVAWNRLGDDDRPEPEPGEMVRIVAPGDLEGTGIEALGVMPGSDEELVLLPIGEPRLLFSHSDGGLDWVDVDGLGDTVGNRQLAVQPDGTIWIATPEDELLQRIPPDDDERLRAEDVFLPFDVIPTDVAVHPDGGVVVGDGRGGVVRLDEDGKVVDEVPRPGTLPECLYDPGALSVTVADMIRPGPTDVHVTAEGSVFAANRASCPSLWRARLDSPDTAEAVLGDQRCPVTNGSPTPDGIVSIDDDTVVVADHFCPGFWVIRSDAEPELVEIGNSPDWPTYPWDGPQDLAVGPDGTLYFPSPHGVYALRLR